ncbi:glycosyltransferase family 2 protein [Desulfovibrio sp. UCD-KL4C]|uniref:glycosyltransferase family 2 protein n=1 Tax=Desulfovibrio sp. UCD-KL4C TaxID=2578120 RepID=UPI0025BA4602|nr:glycosyltransferase family 2 protein [Desulfovibrio sp. UCD-KL4C]
MTGTFWDFLDIESRYRLLVSGHGKPHLMDTASKILNSSDNRKESASLIDLGVDLLLTAWESSPLDGQLATNLLSINRQLNFLPAELVETLSFVSGNNKIPENISFLQRLIAKDDKEKLLEYLASQTKREPENVFWLSHFLDLSFFLGRYELAQEAVTRGWPSAMKIIQNKYSGDIAFCLGDYERAENIYADVSGNTLILGESLLRLAESLDRMGRRDEALILWRDRMTARPWQVNTWFKVHDKIYESSGKSLLDGNVAVCLYTYNKAEEFNATMVALTESPLTNVHIFALNNGSTDETKQILNHWDEKLGSKLTTINLSVNIGAPAARNWLKTLDEIKDFDYVAYLDDDALVPVNWQTQFNKAVVSYPDAGVWGCRIVNDDQEEIIQHADLHLRETPDDFKDEIRGFEFLYLDPHNQDLDYGQFNFCRPCTSVTGCFHLFKKSVLNEIGNFDIRFTPTQYVDVDHDLMIATAGKTAVYQGNLKVRHKRKSGSAISSSSAARGGGAGNLLKLESKYSGADISKIIKKDIERLEKDFTEKSLKIASVLQTMA